MWRLCVVRGAACTGLPRRKIGKIIEIVKIRRVQTRVAQLSRTRRLVYNYNKKNFFFK